MKTIIAAVDFSAITDTVIEEAAQLAKAMSGRIVLLSIVQPPIVATEFAPLVENLAELAASAERSVERRLGDAQRMLAAQQVSCEVVRHSGSPVQHILQEAKARSADYIVMGSHGHTAFYELMVGSTTHGVLLRAACPVVIVPRNRTDAEKRADV